MGMTMGAMVWVVIATVIFISSVVALRGKHNINTVNSFVREVTPTSEVGLVAGVVTTAAVSPTKAVAITSTPLPSALPTNTLQLGQKFEFLIYPGSRLINQTASKQIYETNTDAQTVGQWYKQVLASHQFNIKNYLSSVTNGQAQIMILVSNETSSYSISIRQQPGEVTVIEIETR